MNKRFDRLTNRDISEYYRDIEVYLFPSDFMSAFGYWVIKQNPNKELIDLKPSLMALQRFLSHMFIKKGIPEKFKYDELREIISEKTFETIPEILILNTMKPDFIDLGALARNIFYMILREHITQN